jgi:peptide/nickel transport system permease protein
MSALDIEAVSGPTASSGDTPVGRRAGGGIRRIVRSRRVVVGLLMLGFFVGVAIFGPLIAGNPNGVVGPSMASPSGRFWLGTTQAGQDIFVQLVDSARGSLEVGFEAGLIATVVSVLIGIGGGFIGGLTDELLSLLSNIILVIPALPLIIIVAAFVHSGGLTTTILVIAFTGWAGHARVLRGQTLSVRNRDYVLAARVAGEPLWRIVLIEILPNEMAIIVSNLIFMVVFAILTQSTLAFLGVGDVTTATWGNMLYTASSDEALNGGAWWWFVPPGLCIALVGTALALINFGLDEIFNPRLRVYRSRKGKK